MHLYFSPLACSLATRIALYEAGLADETTFHHVQLWTKQYDDGADYRRVAATGKVPALVTRDGTLLTENAAVLQYVADLVPGVGLAPAPASYARYELQQWLSFISTELHKAVFHVFFHPHAPREAKAYALEQLLPAQLQHVADALAGRPFLVGDTFSVADAYLVTAFVWCLGTKTDLARWPALADYQARMLARPHVARAVREERALWKQEA